MKINHKIMAVNRNLVGVCLERKDQNYLTSNNKVNGFIRENV